MTATDPTGPASATVAPGTTPLVRMAGMAKAFGSTHALRDATFELLPGEVHVLAGENGSGKSTLVKILSGVHAPDAGTIELEGEPVAALRTPRVAQDHGIATVFQEVLVSEARSILDNVALGSEGVLRAPLAPQEKRARAGAILEQLHGSAPDLGMPVERLSLSDRQACCIARALYREPRVLILDEATSALDIATRDRLFEIVGRLTRSGVGVVFITHRMDEISEIGDRITVMRSGRTVRTFARGAWTPAELVREMTGAEQLTKGVREELTPAARRCGAVTLSARGLQLADHAAPFDVEIRAGELLGVAGLEGHGQDDFLEALRGAGALAGTVERHEDGRVHAIGSRADAARHGIAYVPRERRAASFAWMSIRENFGMPTLDRDTRLGLLRPESTRERLAGYVQQLRIVLGDPEHRITSLSGGNQQKVLIARWLAADPRVLLLNDPTRGIDVGAKRDLYELLVRMAEAGLAVVMLSSEVDEHVELMDRVLVFREGTLEAELDRDDLSRHALVASFFGQEGDDDGDA